MVEWVNKFGPAKIFFDIFFFGGGVFFCGWGSKSLDLNIATNKRYGDSRLVAKSPCSKKATVYLATVTIATVANYTLPEKVNSTPGSYPFSFICYRQLERYCRTLSDFKPI